MSERTATRAMQWPTLSAAQWCLVASAGCLILSLILAWACRTQEPTGYQRSITGPRLAEAVQCRGTTERGARCRNRTRDASGYCELHRWQQVATSDAD